MGFKACAVFVAVWHSPADVYENEDAEAVVPIDRQAEGNDRITVYQLPAAQVAAVVHQGDLAEFAQGHAALLEWIDANGYKIVGPLYRTRNEMTA